MDKHNFPIKKQQSLPCDDDIFCRYIMFLTSRLARKKTLRQKNPSAIKLIELMINDSTCLLLLFKLRVESSKKVQKERKREEVSNSSHQSRSSKRSLRLHFLELGKG
jgi:hypothetical protein